MVIDSFKIVSIFTNIVCSQKISNMILYSVESVFLLMNWIIFFNRISYINLST
jgi:hypothetical protein